MKVLVIGDPHGSKKCKKISLKGIDLILIPGDLGKSDLMRKRFFKNLEQEKKGLPEIKYSAKEKKKAFMEAYTSTIDLVRFLSKKLPVFLIFGNVESSNKETRKESKEIGLKLPFLYNKLKSMKNVRLLDNRIANFKGIRIGGLNYFIDSSWVKDFDLKEFKEKKKILQKHDKKVKSLLKKFDKLDIFLCHQPPYRILDKVGGKAPKHWRGKHAGSKIILEFIKKKKPGYVFCGHIHESKGKKKIGSTEVYNTGCCGNYVVLNIK